MERKCIIVTAAVEFEPGAVSVRTPAENIQAQTLPLREHMVGCKKGGSDLRTGRRGTPGPRGATLAYFLKSLQLKHCPRSYT